MLVRRRLTTDQFVVRAKAKHGDDRFDYSQVAYVSDYHKVKIICRVHEFTFMQRPSTHLAGRNGCKICKAKTTRNRFHKSLEYQIAKAREIHGDRYDYSGIVGYTDARTRVTIGCRVHGTFLQSMHNHITGKHGCRKCAILRQGHKLRQPKPKAVKSRQYPMSNDCKEIADWLTARHIPFIQEWSHKTCRDQRPLWFDFFVPSLRLLIEYDGEQHFRSRTCGIFPHEKLAGIQRRDAIKTQWSAENGYRLLRIRHGDDVAWTLETDVDLIWEGKPNDSV